MHMFFPIALVSLFNNKITLKKKTIRYKYIYINTQRYIVVYMEIGSFLDDILQ